MDLLRLVRRSRRRPSRGRELMRFARFLQKWTYKLYELADELVYRMEQR